MRACIGVFAIVCALLWIKNLQAGEDNEAAIKQFGMAKSPSITTGYFFFDFKYIPPPYIVERKGLSIYVNGIQVRPGAEWPPFDERVNEDPGPPPPDVSPIDDVPDGIDPRNTYWVRKFRYLKQNYGHAEAVKKIFELYKLSPKLSKVEWKPGNPMQIVVTGPSGIPATIDYTDRPTAVRSGEDVLKEAMNAMALYVDWLKSDSVVGVGDDLEHVMGGKNAQNFISVLADDALSAEEKNRNLIEKKLIDPVDPEMERYASTEDNQKLLKKRIEQARLNKLLPPRAIEPEPIEITQPPPPFQQPSSKPQPEAGNPTSNLSALKIGIAMLFVSAGIVLVYFARRSTRNSRV